MEERTFRLLSGGWMAVASLRGDESFQEGLVRCWN